jgi:hypothetical protein
MDRGFEPDALHSLVQSYYGASKYYISEDDLYSGHFCPFQINGCESCNSFTGEQGDLMHHLQVRQLAVTYNEAALATYAPACYKEEASRWIEQVVESDGFEWVVWRVVKSVASQLYTVGDLERHRELVKPLLDLLREAARVLGPENLREDQDFHDLLSDCPGFAVDLALRWTI